MQGHSKLTYPPTFKVRPAPDGFYVVDCRDEAGRRKTEDGRTGVGKVVAWFASSEEAAREARERSIRTARAEEI